MNSPTPVRAVLHGWPGRDGWSPPPVQQAPASRGAQALTLTLVAVAEPGAVPERLGLGAFALSAGESVADAGLIVADDLAARDSVALAALERWGSAHPFKTPVGPRPRRVLGASAFNRDLLIGAGYRSRALVVGVDLGRSLGLLAERWAPSTGARRGGWTLNLAGTGSYSSWEVRRKSGALEARQGWRGTRHYPPLYLRALGERALLVRWGSLGDGEGRWEKYEKPRPFSGRFVELLAAAHALDGDSSGNLADHLQAFGLRPVDVPLAALPDPANASRVTALVAAMRDLTLALERERRALGIDLGLEKLHSPGALAGYLLFRMGVRPPLAKPGPDDAALARWRLAEHGGWCSAEMPALPFPGVDADFRSCHPTIAHLLGWWRYQTAGRVEQQDVRSELAAFLAQPDLAELLMDPATWARWAYTLVEVLPQGDRLPMRIDPEGSGAPRQEVAEIWCDEPLSWTWPDAAASTLLTGRPPRIVSATRLVPIGRQPRLTSAEILGQLFESDQDPGVALVRMRREAKTRGERRAAARFKVISNSLVYGQAARLDATWRQDGGRWTLSERPGPWCWPPQAASVVAGSRLILALVECQVRERGGVIAARDTDGVVIPASPEGGNLALPDGATVRALSWGELDAIFAAFDRLSLDGPAWEMLREQQGRALRAAVFGRKKYVLYIERPGGVEVVKATQINLGGVYIDPPAFSGRREDGLHLWVVAGAEALVQRQLARTRGNREALLDLPGWEDFPAFRRLTVSRPNVLNCLPSSLGLHPFGCYVEPGANALFGHRRAVAPDPGGDLAGWEALGWVDRLTGDSVRVATDPGDATGVVVGQRLRATLARWGNQPRSGLEVPQTIRIEPSLLRFMGQGTRVLMARVANPEAGNADLEPRYRQPGDAATLVEAAHLVGVPRLASALGLPERTVRSVASSGHARPGTLARVEVAARERLAITGEWRTGLLAWARAHARPRKCALAGCERPTGKPPAITCCPAHREKLRRLRAKERVSGVKAAA